MASATDIGSMISRIPGLHGGAGNQSRLDTAISRIRDQIAKLQECRTPLSSAAVTGKIDVRIENSQSA